MPGVAVLRAQQSAPGAGANSLPRDVFELLLDALTVALVVDCQHDRAGTVGFRGNVTVVRADPGHPSSSGRSEDWRETCAPLALYRTLQTADGLYLLHRHRVWG